MGSVWCVSEARVCGAGAVEDADRDLGCEQSNGYGPSRETDCPDVVAVCVGSVEVFLKNGKRFSRKITSLEI